MTWDEFVSGWAGANDGYDLRFATAPRRRLLAFAYLAGLRLARFGVQPASLTIISVVCSLAVPLLSFRGGSWPAVAALAVVVALLADVLSGSLGVLTHKVTRLGAFYRAMSERLAEVCWLIALMALGARPALVFSVAALVWTHEYVRARAGAPVLRPGAVTTVGDRPARVWLILAALVLAALSGQIGPDLAAGAVTMVMLGWLTLALIGLGQLLSLVRKVLA